MIKIDMNSKKGITLVTLAVAIIIMLIISTTLIYNISTSSKVRAINNMYQDVTIIKDKVDLYYANHHTIPVLETKYENVSHLESINPNDSDTYYVVDLEALGNLNLTYGQDYETYKTNPLNDLTDLYIINEQSHSIYYAKGIAFEDKFYYTMPEDNTKVTTNSVFKVELIENYQNDVSLKIYAVDKTNGIKKITLMVNEVASKVYEYNTNIKEIKSEIVQIQMNEKENVCYIQVEDEKGNTKNSESITINQIVKYESDTNGNKIPVPFGFSPITTDDQGTKETGFVIKNDEDDNEFVWIPCTIDGQNGTIKYDRYVFSDDTWIYTQEATELDEETNSYKIVTTSNTKYVFVEAMPDEEKQSIKEYGGFYIGRYEAGIEGDIQRTSADKGNVTADMLVQKGKYPYNYISQEESLEKAANLYDKETDGVISKLCSSYAWDTALIFIDSIEENKGWATISTGGNYKQEAGGAGSLQKTGYHSMNNIYDMGGNVYEWTTEIHYGYSANGSNRGGYYGSSLSDGRIVTPAAIRNYNSKTYRAIGNGFRVTLFL